MNSSWQQGMTSDFFIFHFPHCPMVLYKGVQIQTRSHSEVLQVVPALENALPHLWHFLQPSPLSLLSNGFYFPSFKSMLFFVPLMRGVSLLFARLLAVCPEAGPDAKRGPCATVLCVCYATTNTHSFPKTDPADKLDEGF